MGDYIQALVPEFNITCENTGGQDQKTTQKIKKFLRLLEGLPIDGTCVQEYLFFVLFLVGWFCLVYCHADGERMIGSISTSSVGPVVLDQNSIYRTGVGSTRGDLRLWM